MSATDLLLLELELIQLLAAKPIRRSIASVESVMCANSSSNFIRISLEVSTLQVAKDKTRINALVAYWLVLTRVALWWWRHWSSPVCPLSVKFERTAVEEVIRGVLTPDFCCFNVAYRRTCCRNWTFKSSRVFVITRTAWFILLAVREYVEHEIWFKVNRIDDDWRVVVSW